MMSARGRSIVRWRVPSTIKLCCDGNSITSGGQDGADSVGGAPGYLSRSVAPFASQGYANVAIGGQNTDAMTSSASDIDAAFDSSKINILFVQEGTNQNSTGSSPSVNCQKFLDYIAARRASRAWAAVVVATAPPAYLGDQVSQAATDSWNASLDAYNALLRSRYREVADHLIETRCPGSPYDQARYPNYLKATFFSDTVFGGISNNASWITEPSGGSVPNQKIHYTAAGIIAFAPYFAAQMLRTPLRRRP